MQPGDSFHSVVDLVFGAGLQHFEPHAPRARRFLHFTDHVGSPEGRIPTPVAGAPTPDGVVEAYYLQQTRFESINEWTLRRQQLTEDGSVEMSTRDSR